MNVGLPLDPHPNPLPKGEGVSRWLRAAPLHRLEHQPALRQRELEPLDEVSVMLDGGREVVLVADRLEDARGCFDHLNLPEREGRPLSLRLFPRGRSDGRVIGGGAARARRRGDEVDRLNLRSARGADRERAADPLQRRRVVQGAPPISGMESSKAAPARAFGSTHVNTAQRRA